MKIQTNYNLSKLNTFGISVQAKFFVKITSEIDLKKLFNTPEFKNSEKLFLGGGSNVLFTKDFDGLVILNKLKGIKILSENSENVVLRCMGGEIWHDLVIFAVERGWWGIENLALIPGTVGAAPMQNIGAYGRELRDVLKSVEAYNLENGEENKKKVFSQEECELGYRDSIFKNKLKDKYFITAITLLLSKIENKNITYKILQEYLEKNKMMDSKTSLARLQPRDISDAVSQIRKSKLPDPAVIGNAGSFFKNVFVKPKQFEKLQKIYPQIPYFNEPIDIPAITNKNGIIKIPAGWLIEQCGWKGKRIGNVGVHEKQALVLVNYGGADGKEILALANKIIADVREKFGLELVPEVNLV
ncbi:MAG: UDP-N-acetylmuramate dehydrogenase [Patescibacteria group bacterium]